MHFLKLLIIFSIFSTNLSFADTVLLQNGDRLTGEIQSLDKDKLVLKTDYAGNISINRDSITSLLNEKELNITLSNGDAIKGTFKKDSGGKSQFMASEKQPHSNVSLNDIKSFTIVKPPKEPQWEHHGRIDFASSVTTGNTENSTYALDAKWEWTLDKHRHTLQSDGAVEEDNDIKSREEFYLKYQYDYFMSDKWYFTSNATYFQDEFQAIDYRLTIGLGIGYQAWKDNDGSLLVDSSIKYVTEEFTPVGVSGVDEAAWSWSLDYTKKLWENTEAFHQHEGLVFLDNDHKTIIKSKTGLRYSLNSSLSVSTQVDWDHTSDPIAENVKNDAVYSIGIGYKW